MLRLKWNYICSCPPGCLYSARFRNVNKSNNQMKAAEQVRTRTGENSRQWGGGSKRATHCFGLNYLCSKAIRAGRASDKPKGRERKFNSQTVWKRPPLFHPRRVIRTKAFQPPGIIHSALTLYCNEKQIPLWITENQYCILLSLR